jgi:hypothetical protein
LDAYQSTIGALTVEGATVKPDAPILVIRLASSNSLRVSAATSATTINAGPDEYNWAGTTPKLLISDCVAAAEIPGTVTIVSTGSPPSTTITTTSPISTSFNSEARIMLIETSTFFLATPAGRVNPSLYRRYSNGYVTNLDMRVADNVEKWKLTYSIGAEDSNIDATHLTASNVTNWKVVKAVRANLLLISKENLTDGGAPYRFDFKTENPPTTDDKFMRKEMAATFAIRNRITEIQE